MNVVRASARWRRFALVIGTTLATVPGFSGAAVASAAPTGFVMRAGDLVLSSAAGRYTGTMAVSIRNTGREPAAPQISVTVPAGLRFRGAGRDVVCLVTSGEWTCLPNTFAAGERRTVTLEFGSYAGPERFARITAAGTVAVTPGGSPPGAVTDRYAGVLRSVFGSVRHPRFYTPSTDSDLALTAGGGPVVTRDTGGVYVRLPLVARDRTDAANDGAFVGLTVDGVETFFRVDPIDAPCTQVCLIAGDWMAKGEVRDFAVLFTMPAETAAGTYLAQVHGAMFMTGAPLADLTPQDNIVDFPVVVPTA